MKKQDVCDKVIALVKKHSGHAVVNPEDDLSETLGLDSLDLFDLLLDCEITFDIFLEESAYEVRTVQNLIDLVLETIQG